MKALTVRLRLLEPVLVSQAESGEENSAIGLPFIPGSALRGALVSRYLNAHPSVDLATDPQSRALFLDGTVCFLNAYPWYDDSRMLPTPMSWFTEKDTAADEDAVIYDWAVDSDQALDQPKAPDNAAFCHIQDRYVTLYTPPHQINVHIALIDANRRDERNAVYRYDALAEGEVLAGVVVSQDETLLGEIQKLLSPEEIQIGTAHTAGYGRVRIEDVTPPHDWVEYTSGEDPKDGQVIVTLLSNAILRGANGQVDGDLDMALAKALGLSRLKPTRTYRRLRLVGGFNRKWSLPLTQAWALQAGSVYVYPASALDDLAALRQVVEQGVGERRAEGFGRLTVNWHTQPATQRTRIISAPTSRPLLSDESKRLAQRMAQRRLMMLLERKLARAVNSVTLTHRPKNTQLSGVRNAVQRALTQGRLEPITDHLNNLKGAREQFERARIGSTSLIEWIESRVREKDVHQLLLQSELLPGVAGEAAALTEELKVQYTARLIDGVMKKAIKQNQEEAL
jgi:CRISPR-associated protein Csx10